MILYHLTRERNIEQIFKRGLLVDIGIGCLCPLVSVYYRKYGTQPIFLTDDVEYTKNRFCIKSGFVCLKVDIHNLEIQKEYDHQFLCFANIDPERLSYL